MSTTSGIAIEPASEADVDSIAQLFVQDMLDLGLQPRIEDQKELVRAALRADGQSAWLRVARSEQGSVIGVILANIALSVKFGGRSLWIEELYVSPDARQGGIGRALVEATLAWAHAEGFVGIDLEAYRMNTGASILYRSLGFDRLPRERYAFTMSEYLPEEEPRPRTRKRRP